VGSRGEKTPTKRRKPSASFGITENGKKTRKTAKTPAKQISHITHERVVLIRLRAIRPEATQKKTRETRGK